MLSGVDDPMIAEEALKIGVYDYIIKPFEMNEILISTANALRRRQLEIDNKAYSGSLEKMVAERTLEIQKTVKKLRNALESSINAIALTVEIRDSYTAGHQQRVARLADAIALKMGLSEDQVDGLHLAGVIHDLGKIGVPAEILSKPGRISEIEFGLIKTHPQVGYNILKGMEFPWPIAKIVLQHHERINGSGYPFGISSDEILLEAKILGVADVVEAMASHRPYRASLGIDKALEEISSKRGILYDADIVDICLGLFHDNIFAFEEL
ncbi:MAG: HD domain-containing protein [Deltaproteobacteria bacterium]|nr:HD domain-containing protein [Deltaproteobacteria bacterium]